ncbi:hypothetical protein OG592_43040 (plasmid) [Streptomyces avidinii]|uniref:hypothetical protein n=1 Tax=Streptomyces avidinii TaxID=1895 RepID=UPI002F91424A|nr:hypothetical protein OG592_43040 [Streptomyces avidinii]
MDSTVPPEVLREAIVEEVVTFAGGAQRLYSLRERLGLEWPGHLYAEDGMVAYMWECLDTVKTDRDLIGVAQRVVRQVGSQRIEEMLRTYGVRTEFGEFQNLIFAGNGGRDGKPEIALVDATSNRIKITKNRHFWLVYDRPLLSWGLSWQTLLDWWRSEEPGKTDGADDHAVSRMLIERMAESLPTPPPQELFFRAYYKRVLRQHAEVGFEQPALLPEVHLHYDPYTARQHGGKRPLARQRMDFLLLLDDGRRVVIEVDGAQHYSDKVKLKSLEGAVIERSIASPTKYGAMMAADRDLKLDGYELFRVGGKELQSAPQAQALVDGLFNRLLSSPS